MNTIWICLLFIAFLNPGHTTSQGDDYLAQRASLRGLHGVMVWVPHDESHALLNTNRDDLQTEVEVRLREAGIRVLSGTEAAQTGVLKLEVWARRIPDCPTIAIESNLTFEQWSTLERNPGVRCMAITWSSRGGGVIGGRQLSELKPHIRENVTRFVNDFLAANPKR